MKNRKEECREKTIRTPLFLGFRVEQGTSTIDEMDWSERKLKIRVLGKGCDP